MWVDVTWVYLEFIVVLLMRRYIVQANPLVGPNDSTVGWNSLGIQTTEGYWLRSIQDRHNRKEIYQPS
jgi:hypothetical protein